MLQQIATATVGISRIARNPAEIPNVYIDAAGPPRLSEARRTVEGAHSCRTGIGIPEPERAVLVAITQASGHSAISAAALCT